MELPIVIAGAGPGGLVAALALQSAGQPVRLLERHPELRTAGAGLVLQVNAMRMLGSLGLTAPVTSAGQVLRRGAVQTAAGDDLSAFPFDRAAERFGAPSVGIHRGRLARLLAERLAPDTLRFGCEVRGFDDRGDRVEVQTSQGPVVGRVLIGADGIHSPVRTALFGEQPLRYAGYTCWRGIAELAQPAGPGVMFERWGRGRRFGLVPVSDTQSYFFATANAAAGGALGDDPIGELHAMFADFGDPVSAVLDATPPEAVLRNDIIDLPPLKRWTRGRVALLGDAAHAMTPNMGQGACQAIEDGVVLADCSRELPIERALAVYQARRRRRAVSFVKRSWSLGKVAQWANPVAVFLRNALTRIMPRRLLERSLAADWIVDVPAHR